MRLEFYQDVPDSLSYDLLSFTNTSARYVINPVTGVVSGPFGTGVPAVITVNGKQVVQIEAADTNLLVYSAALETANWAKSYASDTVSAALYPDPNDGSRMHRHIPDAANNYHYVYQNAVGRSIGVIARNRGYNFLTIRISGSRSITVNLTTGAWAYSEGTGFIEDLRYQILADTSMCIACVVNVDTTYVGIGACSASGVKSFAGDGVSGVDIWQPKLSTNTKYVSSIIMTNSVPVTRNKDQASIAAARVPAVLKDKCSIDLIPEWSSAQVTTGDLRYICEFADSVQNIKVYYNGTDKKVYVYGASALITSAATTHSANQNLTVSLSRDGILILNGFTTGNGTTIGTSWNRTDGILYVGQDATEVNQFDGLLSEPEVW